MHEDKRQWIINLLANFDDVSTKLVDAAGVRVGPPSVRSTYAGRLQIYAVVFVCQPPARARNENIPACPRTRTVVVASCSASNIACVVFIYTAFPLSPDNCGG